jgi:hypothetical protein
MESQVKKLFAVAALVACSTVHADPTATQAAQNLEQQYQTAVRAHAKMIDLCVQAGIVKIAQLQAGNVAEYQRWHRIEHQACFYNGIFELYQLLEKPKVFHDEIALLSDGVVL